MKYSVSCVMPAYNEEENIAATIADLRDSISKITDRWEIVVVDDGSKDATKRIAEDLGHQDNAIKVVSHLRNKGYGAALRTGFSEVRYELILLWPADGQFETCQIPVFLKQIEGADVVVGNRRHRKDSLVRRLNGLIYNLVIRVLFGIEFKDIDCGFKLYRRYIFDKIKLTCDGALLDTQFFYKAKKNNFKIKQIDVIHKARLYGRSTGGSPKVIFYAMREIIWLWIKLRLIDRY